MKPYEKLDLDAYEKDVYNLIEIYLPKLKHIKNSGNSSYIHKTNSLISIISGAKSLFKYYKTKDKDRYFQNLYNCKMHIEKAIKFLEEIANN